MTNQQLLERIKNLDVQTIENISSDVMARLTKKFDEQLVKNMLYTATTNSGQRRIIRKIKNSYRLWKKDTDMFWRAMPQLEAYPDYLEELWLDIECGGVVTPNGLEHESQNRSFKASPALDMAFRYIQNIEKAKEKREERPHAKNSDTSAMEKLQDELDKKNQLLKDSKQRIAELENEVSELRQQLEGAVDTEKEALDYLEDWQQLSTRELAIFFAQALGVSFDPELINQTQLANLAAMWTKPKPDTIRTKIGKLFNEESDVNESKLDGFPHKTKDEALDVYYFILRIANHYSCITPQMNKILENINELYDLGIVETLDVNNKEKQITKKDLFDIIDKARKSGEKNTK